jgi:hypothetical protein
MADEFFNNFTKQVAGPAPAAAAALEEVSETGLPASPPESLLQNRFVWASAAIVLLMILVLLFR